MQVGYVKNKMRNSRCVSYPFNIKIAANCFHAHFPFKIACFDPESMSTELPKIKSQTDYNRELRMNARKITRNNCVESSDNCQFSAVFLGKIAKCKKFNFNRAPLYLLYLYTQYMHFLNLKQPAILRLFYLPCTEKDVHLN